MKSAPLLSIGAILALSSGSAAADLTLEITSTGPALGSDRPARVFVSDEKMRVDLDSGTVHKGEDDAVISIPTMALIYHRNPEQVTLLDVKKKTYWVVDQATRDRLTAGVTAAAEQLGPQIASLPAEQRQMVEQLMQGMKSTPSSAAIEVRKTERQENVDGQSCVTWEILSSGNVIGETCVTSWQEAAIPKGSLDVYGSLIHFMDPLTAMVPNLNQDLGAAVRGLETIDGFPVRTRTLRDGKVVMQTRLAVVDRKPHPASTFEVPAGYTEEALPLGK